MCGQTVYDDLRSTYENMGENNNNALPFINTFIKKAKKEDNNTQLIQGYRDATYFSSDKLNKLKYADSAIAIAKKNNDYDLISTTYLLKGSLYNFYYKNYQAALEEYLKAFDYSKKGNDNYLQYKIVYQMGLVKSYLGYNEEALELFNECIAYFQPKTKEKNHPNQVYNDTKGFLNSLHQAIVCYQNNGNYKKADSLISIGLNISNQSKDYLSEENYFIKSRGILEFSLKKYKSALENLNRALPLLEKNDDVYWISVSEFYIGKSLLVKGREELAIRRFEKVDSIFKKREFIFPELQENYDLLISYYRGKGDTEKEFAYTKDLVSVNNILKRDFPNLSSKIYNSYDKQILTDSKKNIKFWSFSAIIILIIVIIFLSLGIRNYYKKTKQIKVKYTQLERKLQQQIDPSPEVYETISLQGRSAISKDVFINIQTKLKDFEDTVEFRNSNLTIESLAESFGTNKSYLSKYINDTKGMNFSKYISTLRINYITQMMYKDSKYLLMNVQSLAEECGISSRTNFSNLFQEINGIRPTDFIKQRKIVLEKKEML